MPRQLPSKVPPTMRKRMDSLEIKSIRALEEQMNLSNAGIGHFLSTDKRSISLLLHLLHTLKYPCNSPEFDLINEIVQQNDLRNVDESSKISSVKFEGRKRQNSFPIFQEFLSVA